MQIHLNGRLVPAKEALISVFDHGFLYGDGIYETMRVYDGVTFMLDEHMQRLYRSASMIGLTIPVDVDSLKIRVYDTLISNSLRDAFVRLTVSRGYGPIGIDPDLCPNPTIVIIAEEMREYPKSFYESGISLIISQTRRNIKEALNPQIKSLNFLNNILAKVEAKKKGVYDAIMLNVYGMLAESTISNIFFYKENVLCTPSLDCGILDGITRSIVIKIAKRDGIEVNEGKFTREDLYSAEEVFITNTTLEVMPVSKVDDKEFPVGNIIRLLHKAYREEVNAYVAKVKAEGPSIWGYE
ncbi:MAG: aminodeoxychorismate lyase [Thermodesulfovibrionales bacterium]